MGIGQVISDTFGTVKGRFGSLLGLWAIYFAITIVLTFALGIGMAGVGIAGLSTIESNPLAAGGGIIVVMLLFYIGYIFVAMAQYASLILMASPLRQITLGEALGAGWRAAPALFLLMIVLLVGYFAVAMIFGAAGTTLSAGGEAAGGILALLLLPVLVWLGCRLAPLFAVVAVDGVRNPFAAIARCWRLTRGHALSIFLVSLVFGVILTVICGIALLPSIGLLSSLADPAALAQSGSVAPAFGGIALLFLGFLVASVLFNLLYCAFMAVIHSTLSGAAGEGAAGAFA